MYNKLFTKILDSSVWLEPTPTRIVWLTLIAAMDQDGFAQFASIANIAHRARVTPEEAAEAIAALEAPDPNSADPENEGRRVERVPGGWMVLNAVKYQELVTRAISREQTRIRVARHREKKAGNAAVTVANGDVTPSETDAETHTKPKAETKNSAILASFDEFWRAYPRRVGKGEAEKAFVKHKCSSLMPQILTAIRACKISTDWTKEGGQFIPHPATWLNRRGWEDELLPARSNGCNETEKLMANVPIIRSNE